MGLQNTQKIPCRRPRDTSCFAMFAIISASDPNCTHNGLVHIQGRDQFSLACSMTFQGAWAPVMTWSFTNRDGRLRHLASVNSGTAADHNQLNARYDYSVNYTIAETMRTLYADVWFDCVTAFPSPPAMFTTDPNAATNAPDYQHTFTSDRLQMHCG